MDESGNAVRSTDYYPFGAYLAESTNQEKQPYKYNGKEFDHFAGLNLYDYGARFYDPLMGRFTTPDPLSEKYYSISPYAYCANNPVNAIDPRGDSIWFTNDQNNIIMHVIGKIINVSSNSGVDLKSAAKRISDQLISSFKGTVDGASFSTEVNLTVAGSMDDVVDSDHVFALADMNSMEIKTANGIEKQTPNGASNDYGGKVAFIDADYFSGPLDRTVGNTGPIVAAHEFGHLAGLDDLDTKEYRNNLMYFKTAGRLWGNKGIVTSGQLEVIRNSTLNRGLNYEIWRFPSPSVPGGTGMKKMPDRGRSRKWVNYY